MILNVSMDEDFRLHNLAISFERLKYVSIMLILSYPGFFVVDFFLLRKLEHPLYQLVLWVCHLAGLLVSLVFMLIYHHRNKKEPLNWIVYSHILYFLLIGAVSSINSQLFTGNIYAYLIIVFAVAVIFPIPPRTLCIYLLGTHLFFVAGISLVDQNHLSFVIKLINSTASVVISFTIAVSYHRYRKNDFSIRQQLKRNEESFRRLFYMNPTPLILTKLDDEILLMNKQAVDYYHLDGKNMAELAPSRFLFSNPDEMQTIITRLKKEKSIKNYVSEQQITPGQKKWAVLHFELVDYFDTNCVLIDTMDITDMKEKEQKLLEHATIDALTGVYNRRSGIELLQKEIGAGSQSQGFILCYVDINNLKIVNDRYGHSFGDNLIKTCCSTISSHIHLGDILFRLGGDEFIILFFKKQLAEVQQIWDAINTEFQTINETNQNPYTISASHGFYLFV